MLSSRGHQNINEHMADLFFAAGNWFYDRQGCPRPISEKLELKDLWTAARPQVKGIGTIMICSTGGDDSVYLPITL